MDTLQVLKYFTTEPAFVFLTLIFTVLLFVLALYGIRQERKKLLNRFVGGKWYKPSRLTYRLFEKNRPESKYFQRKGIEKEILEKIAAGKHIVLTGTPLRGKTRTMVECLRQLKKAFVLIPYPVEYTHEIKFPRIFKKLPLTKGKRIIAFNDLQRFFEEGKSPHVFMEKVTEQGWLIVANCRTIEEWKTVQSQWGTSSLMLEPIEIPEANNNLAESAAALNGIPLPPHFDGKNIGTVFVDLDEMRLRYRDRISPVEKQILITIKKLLLSGIYNTKGEILLSSIKKLADKLPLELVDERWLDNMQSIIEKGFVSGSPYAIVPEQVYFDRIVEPELQIVVIVKDILAAFTEKDLKVDKIIFSLKTPQDLNAVVQEFQNAGIKPRVHHYYNVLMARQENVEQGKKLADEMTKKGIPPDVVTYTTLINLCKDFETAVALKDEMTKKGIPPNVVTYNTLLEKAKTEENVAQWINDFCTTNLIPTAHITSGLKKAVTILDKSSKLTKIFAKVLRFNPIMFFNWLNNFDIAVANKFISEFPNEAGTSDFNRLGFAHYYVRHDDLALAKTFLDSTVTHNFYYFKYSGDYWSRDGNCSRAEANYKEALKRCGNKLQQAEIYWLLASVIKDFRLNDRIHEAVEYCKQSISIQPDNSPEAKQLLVYFTIQFNRTDVLTKKFEELKDNFQVGKGTISQVLKEIDDETKKKFIRNYVTIPKNFK